MSSPLPSNSLTEGSIQAVAFDRGSERPPVSRVFQKIIGKLFRKKAQLESSP